MPKLLIVEDNEMNRDMLRRRLTRLGFEVEVAVNGEAGVRSAILQKPDLVLMDIALGEMDGLEATRLIKAHQDTAQIPIIALTAHALESDRKRSLEAGCCDFDTKPVDIVRLVSKITVCLDSQATGRP